MLDCFVNTTGTKCLANRNERSEEESLMEYLFDGYNPSARPVLNSSATVNVKLQFSLLQIQDLVSIYVYLPGLICS